MPSSKLILFLLVLGSYACSSAPEIPADQVARMGVENGVVAAAEASEDIGVVETKIRYNPARCECPDYEVFLYGGWKRVFLTGPLNTVSELQNRMTSKSLEIARVSGRLTDATRLSRENVRFEVFELE